MDLEDLIIQAGEREGPPPLSAGGIPRQRVPSWIRWPLRGLFLPFMWIDLSMQRLAKRLIPPPFKQEGKCKKRGNCCHHIMLRRPKGILGWLFTFWSTEIYGFYFQSKEEHEYEGHKVMVMGCRYLKKDGSCGHYALRPMVCRKWPVIEHFGMPRMLKGCGFKAVSRFTEKKDE